MPPTTAPACATVTTTVTQMAVSAFTTTIASTVTATVTATVTEKCGQSILTVSGAQSTVTISMEPSTVTVPGPQSTVTVSGGTQKDVTTVLLISTTSVASTTITTTETTGTVTITTPGPGQSASTTITRIKYDATQITLIQVVNTAIPPGPPVYNICSANSTNYNYSNSSSSNINSVPDNNSQKDQAYDSMIVAYRMTTPWWAILLIILLILFGLLILAALALLLFGKKYWANPTCPAILPGRCSSCGESCSECVCEKTERPDTPVSPAVPPVVPTPAPYSRPPSGRPASLVLRACTTCGQRHEPGLCGYLGLFGAQRGFVSEDTHWDDYRHATEDGEEFQEASSNLEVGAIEYQGAQRGFVSEDMHRDVYWYAAEDREESQQTSGNAEASTTEHQGAHAGTSFVEEIQETTETSEMCRIDDYVQIHPHPFGQVSYDGSNTHTDKERTLFSNRLSRSEQILIESQTHDSIRTDGCHDELSSKGDAASTTELIRRGAQYDENEIVSHREEASAELAKYEYNEQPSGFDQTQSAERIHEAQSSNSISNKNRFDQEFSRAILSHNQDSSNTELVHGGAQAYDIDFFSTGAGQARSSERSNRKEMGFVSIRPVVSQIHSHASSSYSEMGLTTMQRHAGARDHEDQQDYSSKDTYIIGGETFIRHSYGGDPFSTTLSSETIHRQVGENRSSKKFGAHVSVAEVSDEELEDSDSCHIASWETAKHETNPDIPRSRIQAGD